MGARGVDNDDAGLELQRKQRPDVVGDSQRFGCDVRVVRDLGVDRYKIIFAFELYSVTTQIDERYRIRPGACDLLEKIAKGAAERLLIEIPSANHIEASCLQSLCN